MAKSFRGSNFSSGGSRVVWRDRGWNKVKQRVTEGPPMVSAKVGVLGSDAGAIHPLRAGSPYQQTIEQIAMINEFGSIDGHIPSRSFLRRTFWWNRKNTALMKSILLKVSRVIVFKEIRKEVAIKWLGKWGVERVKETINSNVRPANAPRTVSEKGHGDTLRNTKKLLNSISYVVTRGGVAIAGNMSEGSGTGMAIGED